MKKVKMLNQQLIIILGIVLLTSTGIAHEKTVIIPLSGVEGDATASDVVKGKTFSSKAAGRGVVGTLDLPPCAQSITSSSQNTMTFNLLPSNTFVMGSPNDDPYCKTSSCPHEQPQHNVTLTKPFYMQTTEVTQKQWNAVMHTAPSKSNTGDDYPVESVNWYEAVTFAYELTALDYPSRTACYDLSSCTGTFSVNYSCDDDILIADCTGYRLPTEAEWEYAARATTKTAWAYAVSYDNSADPGQVTELGFNSNLDAMGWYGFNDTTQYAEGTKPVAKKQANKWGLYDMSGNVWEWCQDWYDANYYSDPASTSDPQGPDTGSAHVMRGGGRSASARSARSANRFWAAPGFITDELGFRLVLPPGY